MKKNVEDISVALENLEKGLGNQKGRPKIQVFSDYMDENNKADVEVIPFGIPSVDKATNIGGVPRGRMIELYGPESGGKSYLSLKLMVSAQKMGITPCLIDVEHSFVAKWGADNGLDLSKLLYGADFEYGEQVLDYVNTMCEKGICGIVVVDSTAALIPRAELDGDLENVQPGIQARMMSKAVRQIMDAGAKSNTTVVWINQIREKISMGGKPMWGDAETTPGGKALKFYSHMRIRVVRIGKVYGPGSGVDNERKPVVATKSAVKIIKNKVAAPFGDGEFQISLVAGSDHPIVVLAKKAYDLKAISRKNVDGKMTFMFGKGKNTINSGCDDFITYASWIIKENKTIELLEMTKEKAEEKEEILPEEILKIALMENIKPPIDIGNVGKGAEDSASDVAITESVDTNNATEEVAPEE